MFDIGFFELAVVAVVALFVVGPERLPGLVRTVGYWVGRVRYIMTSVNDDVRRELHNAEILRQEAEQKAREPLQPSDQPASTSSSQEKPATPPDLPKS